MQETRRVKNEKEFWSVFAVYKGAEYTRPDNSTRRDDGPCWIANGQEALDLNLLGYFTRNNLEPINSYRETCQKFLRMIVNLNSGYYEVGSPFQHPLIQDIHSSSEVYLCNMTHPTIMSAPGWYCPPFIPEHKHGRAVLLTRFNIIPTERERIGIFPNSILSYQLGTNRIVLDCVDGGRLWMSGVSPMAPKFFSIINKGNPDFADAIKYRNIDFEPNKKHVIEIRKCLHDYTPVIKSNSFGADKDFWGRPYRTYNNGAYYHQDSQFIIGSQFWRANTTNIIYLNGVPIASQVGGYFSDVYNFQHLPQVSVSPTVTRGGFAGGGIGWDYPTEPPFSEAANGSFPDFMTDGTWDTREGYVKESKIWGAATYILDYKVNGPPGFHPWVKTMADPYPGIYDDYDYSLEFGQRTLTVHAAGGDFTLSHDNKRYNSGTGQTDIINANVTQMSSTTYANLRQSGGFPNIEAFPVARWYRKAIGVGGIDPFRMTINYRNLSLPPSSWSGEAQPLHSYLGYIVWDDWAPSNSTTRTGVLYWAASRYPTSFQEKGFEAIYGTGHKCNVTLTT